MATVSVRPVAELLAEQLARPVAAAIEPRFAEALTQQVRACRPKLAIEIGMAYGISTLAILAGLEPDARMISIDPHQDSQWKGEGRKLVERSDRAASHQLRQQPDYLALPALLAELRKVNFIYIDGMHTFDYVALDAFFADKLLAPGGVVGFNDCGFRSIHKFLKFWRSHRRYEELDAGLAPDYRGRNPLVTLVRRIEGRSNQDRYFRKLEDWEPEHNWFRNF